VVVVFGGCYGYRREQGCAQDKRTQISMHNSSVVA
jgi:hypothetical protein